MILENEFTVGADLDTVWRELLDMEGVASCLPGATISATDAPNVYDGSMRLKIGPMRVEYRGRAVLCNVDEGNHTATIELSAREAKGQGSAMATIRNKLEPADGGTRVMAETELQITGPQAQFGRGVIEDVGKRVLREFSQRLEQKIAGTGGDAGTGGNAGEPAAAATAGTRPAGSTGGTPGMQLEPAPEELDVGALVTSTPAVRNGAVVALVLLVLLILLRRRR